MKIVTAAEMAEIDRVSIEEYGYPGLVLMENAGIRMFELFLKGEERRNPRLVFLAGGGNNGGDALVMARQALIAGFAHISVLLTASRYGEAASIHRRICEQLKIPVFNLRSGGPEAEAGLRELRGADVVFDGIIGTGLQGPVKGNTVGIVEEVNRSGAEVIAVDVPSGVGDSFEPDFPSVRADRTFTVGLPKQCLYRPHARPRCGVIDVLDIGFPRELTTSDRLKGEFLTIADLPALLPPVAPDAHKYTRGTVGVFAGSPGTSGAAFLAADGAARGRAGLVTLMLQQDLYASAAGAFRSVMGRPWDPAAPPRPEDVDRFSALCVGPGWGFDGREPWLRALIESGIPGVLDADGLTLLSRMKERPDLGGRWVLTPHPGEFARLTGLDKEGLLRNLPGSLLDACRDLNAVVVLKGHVTWIGTPSGHFFVIDGMNPAMGTGGSGDVLSGLTAGILAGGLRPEQAAAAAVLAHTEAGRRCFEDRGWFTAEDLPACIARVLAEVQEYGHVR